MRVHQLAKQLGLSTKDMMSELAGMGIPVTNHMASLDANQVATAEQEFERRKKSAALSAPVEPAVTGEEKKTAKTASTEPVKVSPKTEVQAPEPVQPPAPIAETPAQVPAPAEPTPPEKMIPGKGPWVVKDFATLLGIRPNQLIAQLMGMNIFASLNEKVDLKTVRPIADKLGYKFEADIKLPEPKPVPHPEPVKKKTEPKTTQEENKAETRPPVVTFMGHVDHGKTSLLDWIRKTRVAAGESGGITQHIGAYSVQYNGKSITFLDTPGHAAFTAMRARGANLTDIAVIVVAADDGIMPQTREAIQHAQAAKVTMMIAINKCDLPAANPDRVKQQLQQMGLAPEDWGGDVICCPVSATKGTGMKEMLEMILLQAEVLELKAINKGPANGFIVEAQLEPGRGPTATLLVRNGELKVNDIMLCGTSYGKIKAMYDDRGQKISSVGPSGAVRVLGLSEVPEAGGAFEIVPNERDARIHVETLLEAKRQEKLTAPTRPSSLDTLLSAKNAEDKAELAVIIKSDVQGSLEAIQHSLREIKTDKISLNILLAGVGNITTNDVLLAKASNAVIVGFHVSKETGSAAEAKRQGVELRLYSIIYELLDDIKALMSGLLAPVLQEKTLGQAEVKQVFELSKKGNVAGCIMLTGVATSRARARIVRGRDVIYEGKLSSLRRFQNDASEVRQGQECGIRLDNFNDYQPRDIIQLYEVLEVAQQL